MYKVYNVNLLYHGCISLTDTGYFKKFELCGRALKEKRIQLGSRLCSKKEKGLVSKNADINNYLSPLH